MEGDAELAHNAAPLHYTVTAEVDVTEFFEQIRGEDSPELRYCQESATFQHREACEFLVHIGTDDAPEYPEYVIAEMKKAGCRPGFIALYEEAVDAGAVRIIFYA